MSYILEALRRSQAEREQGRAPTLDLAAPAPEPSAPSHNRWGVLAAVLAGVAVLIAVYAAVRPTAGPDPAPRLAARAEVARPAAPVESAPAESALPVADSDAARPPRRPPGHPGDQLASERPPRPRPPPRLPGAPSAAPLVEAPPSKGSAPQTPPSVTEPVAARVEPAQPPPAPEDLAPEGGATPEDAAAAALEEELARRAAQESEALPADAVESSPPPVMAGPTPVPPDLIASIDAFKQEVRGGRGRDRDQVRDQVRDQARGREKGKDKDAQPRVAAQKAAPGVIAPQPIPAAESAQPDQDPTRLRLTREQEAALPKFRLTVHVFDADPSQRFVLINGLRYGEGSKTREGLTVETILQQGAVLSYQGSSFFVHR